MKPINFQMTTNELSVVNNYIADGIYTVAPQFTRTVWKEDDQHDCIRLIVEIKSTEEQPFPVNVKADLTARFETGDIPLEELDAFMNYQTVQILLPYLRAMISSVTTGAYMAPIILPLLNAHDIFVE